MNGQQFGRRTVLGAIAAMALAWRTTGAETATGPRSYGSREEFEDLCTGSGGDFTDTGDGNLWCQYSDGFQEVCDVNGDDCYIFSKPPRPGRPGSVITPPVVGPNMPVGSTAGANQAVGGVATVGTRNVKAASGGAKPRGRRRRRGARRVGARRGRR